MKHTLAFRLSVRQAWWLPWYINGVGFMARLTGIDPDWDRVGRVIARGMRVKASRASQGEGEGQSLDPDPE